MDVELYFERIEQYETGAMNEHDREAFESELEVNAALRQAHAAYLEANAVIEQGVENNLRVQLRQWAAEEAAAAGGPSQKQGGKVIPMRANWLRLAVAASVALLLGWFGWQRATGMYSDDALFAGFYEKPPATGFRGTTNTANPLQEGFDLMAQNQPESALRFFENIPADSSRYDEAQYYLGHAALQANNFDKAIMAFGTAANGKDARFREKAEWNLLLTYLRAGRTDAPEFKALLQRVDSNPAHSYSTHAKALAKKMDSIWRAGGR